MLALVLDPTLLPFWLYVAELYFLFFGIVLIFGGIMGFLKARSLASLIAGGIVGFLFVIGSLSIPRGTYTWMVLDLILSLLLLGRFLPALLRKKYNPAAYVVPLAIIGVILALIVLTLVHLP